MKERNLIKEAGSSKCHVGDTSFIEIYDELDRLASKIKQLGYVPDTDLVLHDVEEEQKEQYLVQHIEKIAVAFGLINTSKSKPMRVFKNLRIWLATEGEIVVRDSNRLELGLGPSIPDPKLSHLALAPNPETKSELGPQMRTPNSKTESESIPQLDPGPRLEFEPRPQT
ncbi:hypothetical protein G4B88_023722 [Cannabis sativa]|uniref:DYW domain-containing protein n=1 Tax=Cannabis sativa TaxID=3483 RepID=A0A7J6HWQ7_CANSA|nr:hypothetical protein G4B88_023722 [Cannabis sativa]